MNKGGDGMFFEKGSFYLRDVFWLQRKPASTPAIGRSHSALSVRLQGSATFHTPEQTIRVEPGDIIFIPAGVDYHIDCTQEELIILHLDAHGDDFSKIEMIQPNNTDTVIELLQQLHRQWQERKPGYRCLCTAKMYELFALLESEAQLVSSKHALLEPGILYLNGHFDDPELTIGTLAEKCRISQVYFRRLFRQEYGLSPWEAIRQRRLQYAARLLANAECSVGQAAALCGFPDVKYFSTAFKTAYGVSPSAYKSGKRA